MSALAFVVAREESDKLVFLHIGSDAFQCVLQPLIGVDAESVARDHKSVEDCVVFGSAVVLTEEIILASKHRGPLTLFYRLLSIR